MISEISKSSANQEVPILGPSEVHVWVLAIKELATLDANARRATYNDVVVNQSLQSCQHFTKLQTREVLRILLSGYVKSKPEDIEIASGANGKPYLVGGDNLNFNVSHTNAIAAIAFSRATEVGVDVEMETPKLDGAAIARAYFCERETQTLQECEESMRSRLFLRYWVRKEACLKALGYGLILPLSSLDVSDIKESVHVSKQNGEVQRCRVFDLPCTDDHAAAVAVVETQSSFPAVTAVRVFQFERFATLQAELLKQYKTLGKAN